MQPWSIDKQPSSSTAPPLRALRRPGKLALTENGASIVSTSSSMFTTHADTSGGLTPEIVSKSSPWKGTRGSTAGRIGRPPANLLLQRSFSTIDTPPRGFGGSMPSRLTSVSELRSPGIFCQRNIPFLPVQSEVQLTPMSYFSPFNMQMGGSRYTAQDDEIDFTQPDPSRPLEIRCCGNSIFVDPQFAQDVSPLFTNFLVRELVAGKQKCVEMQRDDINFSDVLAIARVLCPCDLGMFPCPVDASTFLQLARLSWDLNIEKLKKACDLYICRMPLEDPDLSNDEMCDFLGAAYQYRLSKWTRVRLLECVVGRETRFLTSALKTTNLLPEMVTKCVQAYQRGELNHNNLTNDVKLRIPCRTCRMEQPNVPLAAIKGELSSDGIPSFVKCGVCRTTICCGCILRPCEKLVEDFVTEFCRENKDRIQHY